MLTSVISVLALINQMIKWSSDETDESINPHVYCVGAMPGPANSRPEAILRNLKFGPWPQATQTFLTNQFLVQILVTLIIQVNFYHFWHILHKIETALTWFDTQTRVWYVSAVMWHADGCQQQTFLEQPICRGFSEVDISSTQVTETARPRTMPCVQQISNSWWMSTFCCDINIHIYKRRDLYPFILTLNLPTTTIVAQPFLMFCWPCIIVT
jgi:hypothetical protein